MADDKTKRDFRDRDCVSADEDYGVRYFAKQHRITPEQVRELIGEHGNDRKTLEREARKLQGVTKLSDLGRPFAGGDIGTTLHANRTDSRLAGNAASSSTGLISGKLFGMNSRTMSRLNWMVDLRLFSGKRNKFRASKLASASYGDSGDAPCAGRCDLDGCFGRKRRRRGNLRSDRPHQ
ncbi:DUF3606 domain-containing protein [Mesorhizobium sp.]|uniref:DUF3606 domain-containing protein n=1 Tax=Mesorhizobium sp. TaxID=1871066 RepID=UPI00345503EE